MDQKLQLLAVVLINESSLKNISIYTSHRRDMNFDIHEFMFEKKIKKK